MHIPGRERHKHYYSKTVKKTTREVYKKPVYRGVCGQITGDTAIQQRCLGALANERCLYKVFYASDSGKSCEENPRYTVFLHTYDVRVRMYSPQAFYILLYNN